MTELETLRAQLARAIMVAGEALGTDPSLRSMACVEALAAHVETLRTQVEELTRGVNELQDTNRDLLIQWQRDGKDYRLERERAERAEAKLAAVVEALAELRLACMGEPAMNNMRYDTLGIKVNAALAVAREQPTQICTEREPHHSIDCNGAHQPTQDKGEKADD